MASINGDRYYDGPPGFDRGFQGTVFHSNMWVRGSASLDTNSGILSVTIGCETDSLAYGPEGHVEIEGFDSQGGHVFSAVSSHFAVGGKPPGRARIESKVLPAMHVNNVSGVSRMTVRPYYDGYCPVPLGLSSIEISFTWHS